METSLHRQLKLRYANSEADTEVVMGDYRIDAIRDDELIEVQCASLSAISAKALTLLQTHRLRVVKPVIYRTRIIKQKSPTGEPYSRRLSPKRGQLVDLFEDLIYFTRVFPHPNLVLEVPIVNVAQTRVPATKKRRRSWHKDFSVHDVELESVVETHEFRVSADLLSVIKLKTKNPRAKSQAFDTATIAAAIDRPRWVAQKVAYVLKKVGAIEQVGRNKAGIRYQPAKAA